MNDSLRTCLPRTFGAFLGRFPRPTAIQTQAVPAILEGRDVLLCAPTAGGKTEAFAAPCAERLLAQPRPPSAGANPGDAGARRGAGRGSELEESVEWLLVSPTRALANDLHRRLEARMHTVGLSLGRYTGERKERSATRWPRALICTPESLDSLLSRRAHVLAQVRQVVIDEVHVLDGTVRGDQLRVLLHRLARAVEGDLQRIAASATLGHAAEVGRRYLVDPWLCEAQGERKVKAKSFAGTAPKAMAKHLTELARGGLRKVLIFVPSRRDVDELAQALHGKTPFGPMVFAHHGSLSQAVRERTERQFHDAPAAVAVATQTLELGIDIGTVDYVLLSSPPANVASLMQRIGRGGRRGEVIRFGYAWRNSGEEFRFRVMARAGVRGDLLVEPYGFRASVLVQQAACIAGGAGYVSLARLRACLPPTLADRFPDRDLVDLLRRMVESEALEPGREGRFVLSPEWEQRYDRGTLHSNLADPGGKDVVDRLTGEVVARIGQRPDGARTVQLGGAGRRVVSESERRVLTDAGGSGAGVRYVSQGSPLTSFALGRALATELGAPANGLLVLRGEGPLWLVHGLGTMGGLLLAAYLAEIGVLVTDQPTAVTLRIPRAPDPWVPPEPSFVSDFVRRHKARLVRLGQLGPFHRLLPPHVAEATLVETSGLLPVVEFLSRATWEGPRALSEVDPAVLHL